MSNQPPIGVPQGAIRLNTDSQKLEFYAQDRWYEMATDTPNLGDSPVGVRGLFFGEFDDSSNTPTIDYVTISSQGNATDYGDLINSVQFYGGVNSSHRRWIYFGGAPGHPTNQMQFGEIATTGNGTDFGDLTQSTHYNPSGVGNRTRGVRMGGSVDPSGGAQNNMDYWAYDTLGNAVDFGDLVAAKRFAMSANSPTRGMIYGGSFTNPTIGDNIIQFITIASTGNAQTFGDIGSDNKGFGGNGACCNATRALFGGGGPSYKTIVSTVQMATTGNSYDFGDLTVARNYPGSTASATRAVWGGGYYTSPATYVNVIDYMSIATGGNAVDFGDRSVAGSYVSGCSNGHGGL